MYSCSSFVENFTFFIGIEPAKGNYDDDGHLCGDRDDIVAKVTVLFLHVALIPFKGNPPSISNEDHWQPYYCTFSMLSTFWDTKFTICLFYRNAVRSEYIHILMVEYRYEDRDSHWQL